MMYDLPNEEKHSNSAFQNLAEDFMGNYFIKKKYFVLNDGEKEGPYELDWLQLHPCR